MRRKKERSFWDPGEAYEWARWLQYKSGRHVTHAHTHTHACVQSCTGRVGRAMESLSHEHSTYHSDPKSLWHWVTAGLPVYSFVRLHVWTSLKCKTVQIKTCVAFCCLCARRILGSVCMQCEVQEQIVYSGYAMDQCVRVCASERLTTRGNPFYEWKRNASPAVRF